MRARILVLALAFLSTSNMCGLAAMHVDERGGGYVGAPVEVAFASQPSGPSTTRPTKVDFATQVKPIMQARCQPCHFQGGTMYQKLPFDRPETIKTLGERLFTRIREENDRRVIKDFLSQ